MSENKLIDAAIGAAEPLVQTEKTFKDCGPRPSIAWDTNIMSSPGVHNSYDDRVLGRLVGQIDNWGRQRQLEREHGCTALSQIRKLKEEVQEIEDALIAGDELEMIDGIGDSITVLIQIMRLTHVSMVEALERAHSQIRYRKGKMVDGVFVKEAT